MNKFDYKLGDTVYSFHFGIGFLGELLDKSGYELAELMELLQKNTFKVLPKIMLHSAQYSAMRKGEDFDKDEFHFVDLIDENGGIAGDFVAKFLNAFTLSMNKDVPKEETKKKVRKAVK